ncbi:hypothetical protein [Rhodopirellula bahusiensis]|uniref:hypothetical protein n=2 Tax=Rhodopirellula bahusiensis TaxID=2014065 RepID=UPI003263D026
MTEDSMRETMVHEDGTNGSKTRGSSYWRILKMATVIVLLLAAWSVAWGWKVYRSSNATLEQARISSAAMVEQARVEAEKLRYRERNPLSAEDIRSDRFQSFLDRISVDVTSQKIRLRDVVKARTKTDPHLEDALLNVFDEPLAGSEKPIYRDDLYEEFMIDVDVLIDRFKKRHEQVSGIDSLAEKVRDCFWHNLMNKHPPVESLNALIGQEELGDPLIGLALTLCDPDGGAKTQLNRVRDASNQIAEAEERYDPLLTAWVSTMSLGIQAQHYDADQFDTSIRRYMSAWPIAWCQFSQRADSVGRDHACLLRMLGELERLNASATMDFFDELTSSKVDGVPDFVLHAVAHEIISKVAWDYRGNQFVSKTNESDFDVYLELAAIANTHAVEAYVQRPELAKLATEALSMQKQLSKTPLSTHHWFRLALSGHLDYDPAFGAYSISLMPRWGGSESLQKKMTMKCLEADSPDGAVEMCNTKFVRPYLERKSKDESAIETPFNLAWARKLIPAWEKYHSVDRTYQLRTAVPSWALQILWEAGDFENVILMMDTLGEHVNEVDWVGHNMDSNEVRFVSELAKGESRNLWMTLHRQVVFNSETLDAEQLPKLRKNLDTIEESWLGTPNAIEACCPDGTEEDFANARASVERLLKNRREQLQLLERFHRGEQIHFTFDELDATMRTSGPFERADWRTIPQCEDDALRLTEHFNSGSGPFDESNEAAAIEEPEWDGDAIGGIQVRVDRMNRFFYLHNNTRYPLPARYEVTVTALKDEYSPYGMGILCGPDWNFGLRSKLNGMVFRFAPGSRYFYVNDTPDDSRFKTNYREWSGLKESDHTMRMRLDVGRRGYHVYADDELLHSSRQSLRTGGIFQVGRSSNRAYDIDAGKECIYNLYDFKVQKLTQGPFEASQTDDVEGQSSESEEGRTNEAMSDSENFI